MDLIYDAQILRTYPKMCNISQSMTNVMDKQPIKNIQDLKPLDISNTAQETNKKSTNELGLCIV